MKKTLLCTLPVMLFALVGCGTDWNELCAKARVGYGAAAGDATREIDKQAGICYAAWTRCNQKMTSGPENTACFSCVLRLTVFLSDHTEPVEQEGHVS